MAEQFAEAIAKIGRVFRQDAMAGYPEAYIPAWRLAEVLTGLIFMAKLVVGRTPLIVRKDGLNGYGIDDGCAGEKFQGVLKSRQSDPN